MTKNTKIINIDWLQINVHSVSETLAFHPKYEVKQLLGATRHFAIVEEIHEKGRRVATLTRKPLSPIIPEKTILIKFDNWVLYQNNLYDYVQTFLNENLLTFKSVSRLDIALDFQKFDNGLTPQTFIRNFLTCKYIKKRKSKFSIFGTHGKTNVIDYLRFGSPTSQLSYYLYNKTKELTEAKEKPHIRETWELNGFEKDNDVWRLEFRIQSATKDVVDTETGETFQLKDLSILKHVERVQLYNMLLNHYWVFYKNDGQKIKARMKEVKLFTDVNTSYQMIPKTKKRDSSRSDKIFIKKLCLLNNELRQSGEELNETISNHLLHEFTVSRSLAQWAKDKGYLPKPVQL